MFLEEDPSARFNTHFKFPDPSNTGQVKTKVIVLKYYADFEFKPEENFIYCSENIELLEMFSRYQTPKLIKRYVKNNFDAS